MTDPRDCIHGSSENSAHSFTIFHQLFSTSLEFKIVIILGGMVGAELLTPFVDDRTVTKDAAIAGRVSSLGRRWTCLPEAEQKENSHRWTRMFVGIRQAKDRRKLPPLEMIKPPGWKESLSCCEHMEEIEKEQSLARVKAPQQRRQAVMCNPRRAAICPALVRPQMQQRRFQVLPTCGHCDRRRMSSAYDQLVQAMSHCDAVETR